MAWDALTLLGGDTIEGLELGAGTHWTLPIKLYDGMTTHSWNGYDYSVYIYHWTELGFRRGEVVWSWCDYRTGLGWVRRSSYEYKARGIY